MLDKLILWLGVVATKILNKFHEQNINRKCIKKGNTFFYYKNSSVDNLQEDKSAIQVGSETHIKGQLLVFANGGNIKIGDNCYIGENSRIWSMSSIEIGNRVLISHGVNIHDSDSHSISAALRHEHFKKIVSNGHPRYLTSVSSAPIWIGNDVWIGFNASIMKGVTIGQGAVIGSNAVVTENVPEYAIAVGNPAQLVGRSQP